MRAFVNHPFWRDTRGNILMLTGLGILFLVGIGGAGYDLGHQQLVRQKIQQAADAAALAAAGMDFGTPDATRQSTAQAFFALNYPQSYLGIARPTPSVVIANEQVTVSANTSVPTSFVGNFGVSTIAAVGSSRVQFKRIQTVIDAILVLDNSGSMANMDVGAGNSTNAAGGVRPICRAGWIAYFANFGVVLTNAQANLFCDSFEGATGLTRLNALRFSAGALADSLMTPNPLNNRIAVGTWDLFGIRSQTFTNRASTVKSFLGTMYGRGATNSTVGMQQAQIFSSSFRPGTAHAVVLMTDGANFGGVKTDAFGNRDFAAENAERILFNTNTIAICNSMKSSGTIIYTVGYGAELSNSSQTSIEARQFLSDCATGPNGPGQPNLNTFYFSAPDAVALASAFNTIAGSLKKVQILQ